MNASKVQFAGGGKMEYISTTQNCYRPPLKSVQNPQMYTPNQPKMQRPKSASIFPSRDQENTVLNPQQFEYLRRPQSAHTRDTVKNRTIREFNKTAVEMWQTRQMNASDAGSSGMGMSPASSGRRMQRPKSAVTLR